MRRRYNNKSDGAHPFSCVYDIMHCWVDTWEEESYSRIPGRWRKTVCESWHIHDACHADSLIHDAKLPLIHDIRQIGMVTAERYIGFNRLVWCAIWPTLRWLYAATTDHHAVQISDRLQDAYQLYTRFDFEPEPNVRCTKVSANPCGVIVHLCRLFVFNACLVVRSGFNSCSPIFV